MIAKVFVVFVISSFVAYGQAEITNITQTFQQKIGALEQQNNNLQNQFNTIQNQMAKLLDNQEHLNTMQNKVSKLLESQDSRESNQMSKTGALEQENKNLQNQFNMIKNQMSKLLDNQDNLSTIQNQMSKLLESSNAREVCFDDLANSNCTGSQTGQIGIVEAVRVAGGWGPYSEWSSCSATCGEGVQVRNRSCSHPSPKYGGRPCAGADVEQRKCNMEPCCPEGSIRQDGQCSGSMWIQSSDKDCWGDCGSKGGLCPSVCGAGGYCCRDGFDGCPPQAAKASLKYHSCVTEIPSHGDCVQEDNIDYFGNNLHVGRNYVKTDTAHQCAKWCGVTEGCKFWTFHKSQQGCWLKYSNAGRRSNSDVISGTKSCAKDSELTFQLKGNAGQEKVTISIDGHDEEFILTREWKTFSYPRPASGSFSVEFHNDTGHTDVFIQGHESEVEDLLPDFHSNYSNVGNNVWGCGTAGENERCASLRSGALLWSGKYTFTLINA